MNICSSEYIAHSSKFKTYYHLMPFVENTIFISNARSHSRTYLNPKVERRWQTPAYDFWKKICKQIHSKRRRICDFASKNWDNSNIIKAYISNIEYSPEFILCQSFQKQLVLLSKHLMGVFPIWNSSVRRKLVTFKLFHYKQVKKFTDALL